MLPLVPPYAINDLAHEMLVGSRAARQYRRHDPDRFLDESSALRPDPVYMGFRYAVSTSPIARLARWLDRRAEAREDRVLGLRAGDAVRPTVLPAADPIHLDQGDDRSERKTAA